MIFIIYLLQGATLALSAAIMPGPFQAFLLSRALRHGWRRTLPAALAPLVTDGPIISLVLFVLTRTPQEFLDILRIAGGLFILYLARGIFLTLRQADKMLAPPAGAGRQAFLHALMMNFLNPNPYIFWSVVAGPIVLTGWRTSPALGITFLAGFYGTFVSSLVVLIILFASAGKLGPRTTKILACMAALALVAFGIYQVTTGVTAVLWTAK